MGSPKLRPRHGLRRAACAFLGQALNGAPLLHGILLLFKAESNDGTGRAGGLVFSFWLYGDRNGRALDPRYFVNAMSAISGRCSAPSAGPVVTRTLAIPCVDSTLSSKSTGHLSGAVAR